MKTQRDIPENTSWQPRFTVGCDRHGYWIVADLLDLVGGLFASREAALRFARQESGHMPGAVRCLPDNVILKFGPTGRRRKAPVADHAERMKSA